MSISAVVSIALLALATNPAPAELSLATKTDVPLGVALSSCLATETPLVKEFYGEIGFSENIRFTFVKKNSQLSAWIVGPSLSAESAKLKLKVAERLVSLALNECAATYGLDSRQVLSQIRFVYANWRQSELASPVLSSIAGKYELP